MPKAEVLTTTLYLLSFFSPIIVNSKALLVCYSNSQYDKGEDFLDENNNSIWDYGESFEDKKNINILNMEKSKKWTKNEILMNNGTLIQGTILSETIENRAKYQWWNGPS